MIPQGKIPTLPILAAAIDFILTRPALLDHSVEVYLSFTSIIVSHQNKVWKETVGAVR